MSKARDIASAAPAPSTVSATELGYVDGVTSAIQTQIDSKIGSASAINPTIVDAKGDIIAATAADTVARLAVGTNGQVLTAASGQATGLQWATPAAGGKVLQVIMGENSTNSTLTTTTYSDINLSASITPSSASSKVLVMVTQSVIVNRTDASNWANWRLMRDSTAVYNNASANRPAAFWGLNTLSSSQMGTLYCGSYLDSPATTSATTYKTQWASHTTSNSASININSESGTSSTIILMEIGA
jgi:hypothetical protein